MAGAAQPKQDVIRIVLADDDEGFLESLRALVEEHPSLSVEATATDGLRATELVRELEPDALVIDLHMPRLDGVAAIAQIRAKHPTLCLIALTGDESHEIHQAVAEAGGDAVLLKSEMVENLAERLVATIPLLHPSPEA
ncbi:MAG TPA: response regulator transcription factor [Gaiellaceae bacterium]|nr:response regulator transcription factor [Gaiellaceae bacterium]